MIRNYLSKLNKLSLTTIAAGMVLVVAPAAAASTLTPSDPVLTTTTCDVTVNTTNPAGSGWRIVTRVDGVVISSPTSFVASTGSTWSVAERALDKTQTFPNGKNVMLYKGTAPDAPYCHDNPPVANDFRTSASTNATKTMTLYSHVSDPDAGDTYKVTSVSNAVNATVTLNKNGKTVQFTSAPDFVGTATFDYQATDSFGKTDTGTVTVSVTQAT